MYRYMMYMYMYLARYSYMYMYEYLHVSRLLPVYGTVVISTVAQVGDPATHSEP